jgi:EpsI family protein
MSGERWQLALLAAALVAVGAAAWAFELRPPLAVDASALAELPRRVEGYEGHDLPLEGEVERVLQADANLQRAYLHPFGDLVWLYVGYYGTERGGWPEHRPEECYPTAGWRILEERRVDVDPASGLRANEFVVEHGRDRQLVHFWYQSHRSAGLLGPFDHGLDRLLGRLVDGRSDGALVRLSTPLPEGDEAVARTRLAAFARALVPLLVDHWPDERAATSS